MKANHPLIEIKCPNCNAPLNPDPSSRTIRCEDCGHQVLNPFLNDGVSDSPPGERRPALSKNAAVFLAEVISLLITALIGLGVYHAYKSSEAEQKRETEVDDDSGVRRQKAQLEAERQRIELERLKLQQQLDIAEHRAQVAHDELDSDTAAPVIKPEDLPTKRPATTPARHL